MGSDELQLSQSYRLWCSAYAQGKYSLSLHSPDLHEAHSIGKRRLFNSFFPPLQSETLHFELNFFFVLTTPFFKHTMPFLLFAEVKVDDVSTSEWVQLHTVRLTPAKPIFNVRSLPSLLMKYSFALFEWTNVLFFPFLSVWSWNLRWIWMRRRGRSGEGSSSHSLCSHPMPQSPCRCRSAVEVSHAREEGEGILGVNSVRSFSWNFVLILSVWLSQ
jgi:hypothetical protein